MASAPISYEGPSFLTGHHHTYESPITFPYRPLQQPHPRKQIREKVETNCQNNYLKTPVSTHLETCLDYNSYSLMKHAVISDKPRLHSGEQVNEGKRLYLTTQLAPSPRLAFL